MPLAKHQMPSCPLMMPAWLGALRFAVGNTEIMAAFQRETGLTFTPAATGLDRMIDEATGANDAFMSAFVDWFNANVWGDLDEPAFGGSDGGSEP